MLNPSRRWRILGQTKSTSVLMALALYAAIAAIIACDDSELSTLVNDLKHGEGTVRGESLYALHALGIDGVPVLIDAIDDTVLTIVPLLTHPLRSDISRALDCRYAGLLPAYAIELILARGQLSPYDPDISPLGLSSDGYLYREGVILRRHDREVVGAQEMKHVKSAYAEWWAKHAHQHLVDLGRRWHNGDRPLTGSDYVWE